nr:hypothetical protein [Tanacetum cinerariifolium]
EAILLDSIDWRTLDVSWSIPLEHEEIQCDDELHIFKEKFNKQSNARNMSLLKKASPPQSEPHETIVIAHMSDNYYIKAALRECCPLLMTHPLWTTYKSDIASGWKDPYVIR